MDGGDDAWASIPLPEDEKEYELYDKRFRHAIFTFWMWFVIVCVVGALVAMVGPWDWYVYPAEGQSREFKSAEAWISVLLTLGFAVVWGLLMAKLQLWAAITELKRAIEEKRASEEEDA